MTSGVTIEPGSKWVHWKGSECVIVAVAREEASGNAVVVYHYPDTGNIWTRPLGEFLGMVKREDALAIQRFARVSGNQPW